MSQDHDVLKSVNGKNYPTYSYKWPVAQEIQEKDDARI